MLQSRLGLDSQGKKYLGFYPSLSLCKIMINLREVSLHSNTSLFSRSEPVLNCAPHITRGDLCAYHHVNMTRYPITNYDVIKWVRVKHWRSSTKCLWTWNPNVTCSCSKSGMWTADGITIHTFVLTFLKNKIEFFILMILLTPKLICNLSFYTVLMQSPVLMPSNTTTLILT